MHYKRVFEWSRVIFITNQTPIFTIFPHFRLQFTGNPLCPKVAHRPVCHIVSHWELRHCCRKSRLGCNQETYGRYNKMAINLFNSLFVMTIPWSAPGTFSKQSVLLVAGLPCALSPAALMPVLVLQCISTDTDIENCV